MANIASRTWHHASTTPDAVAVREGSQSWSYAELVRSSAAFADRLRAAGVGGGDRVLLVAPTTAAFVVSYLGILASGAVAVTVNNVSTQRELEYVVDDAGCQLIVVWHEAAGAAHRVAASRGVWCWSLDHADLRPASDTPAPDRPSTPSERRPEDPAVLLYTSGTTGRPKGAVLTHGNIAAATSTYCEVLQITPADRMGTALPLFHVFGQVAVLGVALDAGASISVLRPFSGPALLQMVGAHQLTVLSGVPTMWIEMLHSADTLDVPPDIASLRICSSGGAALPLDVARDFTARFGATVLDGYGLSETTSAATFQAAGRERREGSVGQALPGLDIRVVDENGQTMPAGEIGEITIAGAVVTPGYWNNPDATRQAVRGGRFHTGDMGCMDKDGYLWIVDRKKDLIIRGGYNVYPREVEEVIHEHPAVRGAAVVGVPDPRLGEVVAAVVELEPGTEVTPGDLRAWLSDRVAPYKVPQIYHVVDELPKGSTGKILKREIDRHALVTDGLRPSRTS